MSHTDAVRGVCPECDGEATVYPTEQNQGHIFCEESDCGWVHRNKPGIDRHIESDAQRGEADV